MTQRLPMAEKLDVRMAIESVEKHIKNPKKGLPEEVFHFISRTTPMVNVDILIKDERGRTLLSWRNDPFHRPGWHIPGGVVRFKETFWQRLQKVVKTEIGTRVRIEPVPVALNEIIRDYDTRGHFISVLYKGFVLSSFNPKNKRLKENDKGFLKWHDSCPDDIIEVHEMYRKYIDIDCAKK